MQRWLLLLAALPVLCRTADELKQITLMSYNVMLLPSILVFQRDQITRAHLLTKAKFLRTSDILCLQEVFQIEPSAILLKALAETYRYSTPILGDEDDQDEWNEMWNTPTGTSPLKFTSGGVMILSKWPITYAVQYFYKHACSAHRFVRTGFVYSRILYGKKKRPVHVFGTHLQPNDYRGCYRFGEDKIREAQLQELNDFILSRNFSRNELVFILGDFNINRYHQQQYETMLNILNVNPQDLHASSVPYSWDSSYNAMTNPRHGNQLLDYILLHRHHNPIGSSWLNLITDRLASEQWHLLGRNHSFYNERNVPLIELSDHYPVTGFYQANPPSNFRRPSGVITSVQLYTADTHQPVVLSERALHLASPSSNDTPSAFILTNNATPRRHRCLRSEQFVLLIDHDRPQFYLSNEKFLRMKYGREHANRYLKIIHLDPIDAPCIGTNSTFLLQSRSATGYHYVQNQSGQLCSCTTKREKAQQFRLVEVERRNVTWTIRDEH